MATRKSIILLSDPETDGKWKVAGEKFRADTFFGYTDGNQTVSVQFTEFTGIFRLQGTLSLTPSEQDWFTIIEKEYPVNELDPTGNRGDTGIDGFDVEGNFLYVRAVMDRRINDTEPTTPDQIEPLFGKINKVLMAL